MVGPAGDRRGAAHLELTWTVFEKEALRAAVREPPLVFPCSSLSIEVAF